MSDLEKMLEDWRKEVHDPGMDINPDGTPAEGFNMIHEVWSPRWKCFQPPMWKIFRWAYKIKRTLYTGCYPAGMTNGTHHIEMKSGSHTGNLRIDQTATGDGGTMIGIQFSVSPPPISPELKKQAEEVLKNMRKEKDECSST